MIYALRMERRSLQQIVAKLTRRGLASKTGQTVRLNPSRPALRLWNEGLDVAQRIRYPSHLAAVRSTRDDDVLPALVRRVFGFGHFDLRVDIEIKPAPGAGFGRVDHHVRFLRSVFHLDSRQVLVCAPPEVLDLSHMPAIVLKTEPPGKGDAVAASGIFRGLCFSARVQPHWTAP